MSDTIYLCIDCVDAIKHPNNRREHPPEFRSMDCLALCQRCGGFAKGAWTRKELNLPERGAKLDWIEEKEFKDEY